jgi:toxin ParE1/3/4
VTLDHFVSPEAEQDLTDAWGWYESQRDGLGDEFLLCVEAAFEFACRQPRACPIVEANIRRVLVHRFPYGVFFIIEPKRVIVLSVAHAARDPEVWKGRR